MNDPFTELGQRQAFDLDEAKVRSAHRAIMARLHPDREQDPIRRAEAVGRAAAANQALRTLLDPVERAEALLRLAAGDSPIVSLPPEFLARMLELRERVTETLGTAHAGEVRAEIDQARDEITRELAAAFAAADFPAVREALARLRYLRRMSEQARPGEEA